jgi:hypothetical protein
VVGDVVERMKTKGDTVVSKMGLSQVQSVQMGRLGDNTDGEASMVDKAMGLFEGWCTKRRARSAAVADGK